MIDSQGKAPLFPRQLSAALAIIPPGVHATAVVTVLYRTLAGALRNGEPDFLQGRTVRIHVRDMQLSFLLPCNRGRWRPAG